MRNQSQWIDALKNVLCIRTDYKLAKRWRVEQTRIHQYRKGRLKLPLFVILDIAESINIDPLEIISSLEFPRARECDRQTIQNAFFDAAVKTVGNRLDEPGHGSGFRPRYPRRR